ncbi:11001_t:CDS:2, partial [Cetraspora pellucida]
GSDIKTSIFWFNSSEHPRRGGVDFLLAEKAKVNKEFKPALILCNPPFNGLKPKLAPEVWLDKIIELFGNQIPIVLFVPAGFRANLTLTSKRKMKFETGEYPPIVSFISLPKNIFPGLQIYYLDSAEFTALFNLDNLIKILAHELGHAILTDTQPKTQEINGGHGKEHDKISEEIIKMIEKSDEFRELKKF